MPSYRFDQPYFEDGYHFGNRGLGVLAEEVPPNGTHGPSAFYDSLQLPGDVGTEIRGVLLTAPSSGVFTIEEDGTCSLIGASDGVHTATLQMEQDGVDKGVLTITLYINATTPVSNDLDGAYSVIGRVQSDLDASYSLIGRVSQDLDGNFNITGIVAADLDAEYMVLNESVVISDLDGAYSVLGTVVQDLDGAFNIIGKVARDLDGAYNLLAAASQDLDGAYGVLGTVHADLDASFGIAGPVTADLDASYVIRGQAGDCPTADEIATAVWAKLVGSGARPAGSVLADLHLIHGLVPESPLVVSETTRTAGEISQTIAAGAATTVTRT